MTKPRVMMIGLDGFETSLADRLIREGRLPAMKRLRSQGAVASLDHGDAKRTGLAWEHVATGLCPDDARRWAAVDFDPASYAAWQRPTNLPPFAAKIDVPTLVFDAPYFDLAAAPAVRGLVAWGAHDPGVPRTARPEGLAGELTARFGPYPAPDHIYGFVWPSAQRSRAMARALSRAVDVRFAATEWLFTQRATDWRLGLMVVSEFHSAAEALWHGVDEGHPLHRLPSAIPAREGLETVYEAADRGLARLIERLPDTAIVLFNLHGMGANDSDPGSMVLLAELMFRHSLGRPLLRQGQWSLDDAGVPLLQEEEGWEHAVMALLPAHLKAGHLLARGAAKLGLARPAADRIPVGWMPAARYAPWWPRMRAFALPSFYDGRIRINLIGRESKGRVAIGSYGSACDEIESLLLACHDPRTGLPAVARVERNRHPPLDIGASEPDLVVIWKDAPLGLEHPALGTIGPLPYRRTGGHTGGRGFAWLAGPGIPKADLGTRSAFDLVPTVVAMLGEEIGGLSGTSFAPELAREKAAAEAGP